jgi:hypothetical protein
MFTNKSIQTTQNPKVIITYKKNYKVLQVITLITNIQDTKVQEV